MATFFRGTGICVLGLSMGLALVKIVHLPKHMLVGVVSGLLLVIFPISPASFLLGYLVCLPFLDLLIPFLTTRSSELPFGPQVLIRGGLVVLLVYYWLVNMRNPLIFKPAVPMFILLCLLAFSTLTSSIKTQLGYVSLAKLACWMLLLPTVADMVARRKMKLNTIYRCIVASNLGFVVVVLTSPFLGISLGSFYGVGEARGPYAPHSLALCLCMGLIVILALSAKQQNKFFLLLLLLFGVVITFCIARTYVRTGYTSMFMLLLVFALMSRHYGRKEKSLRRNRLVLGLAPIILMGFFAVYGLVYSEAFEKRMSDFSSMETAGAGRLLIYEAALRRYADFSLFKQVFGGGLQATHYLLGSDQPHNELLYILLSGGLVGIGLYLWLIVSLWKQVKSNVRATYLPLIAAGSAIAAFLVATMTMPVIELMSLMTYFSFLVGGAIGYYAKGTRKKEYIG